MNDLFISIKYNNREFDNIESFKSSIEKDYHCQVRPIWIPACSEGAEMWMTIFINSEIGEFLKNIIISGIVWDIIKYSGKKYIFGPLFSCLEKLNTDNKKWDGVKLESMIFQFDDCVIKLSRANSHFTLLIPRLFKEIAQLKPSFEKRIGMKVISIDILNEEEDNDFEISNFFNKWKITFETNHPILIYDFKTNDLSEYKRQ